MGEKRRTSDRESLHPDISSDNSTHHCSGAGTQPHCWHPRRKRSRSATSAEAWRASNSSSTRREKTRGSKDGKVKISGRPTTSISPVVETKAMQQQHSRLGQGVRPEKGCSRGGSDDDSGGTSSGVGAIQGDGRSRARGELAHRLWRRSWRTRASKRVLESSRRKRGRELSGDEPMEVVGLRVEHPADYVTWRLGDGPAANAHAGPR